MPRRRRPAAETRAAILDAAQIRLRADGPGALRLDDVAGDVGISRQAVLHHFGSREGLMRAVVEQAWTGLFTDLAGLAGAGELQAGEFVELVDDVARRRGNARLGAWLLLSGQGLPDEVFEARVSGLVGVAGEAGEGDDAGYALLAAGAALFGDAIFGDRLRQVLGLPDGEDERAAFRAWLANRLGGGAAP
jgi:AcrR family transcriptional regulator